MLNISWALVSAGLLVLLLTLVDLVWTTLTLRGGGPVTQWLSAGVWRSFLSLHRQHGELHALLSQCGWLILSLTLLVWLAMTWLGWILIFAADPQSVINERTGESADLVALIYFTGFTISTLGVGDYAPNGALWQILTPVATINGFILITLSVTYLLQVLAAAVGDRKTACLIYALGGSPAAILQTAWNGADFSRLSHSLTQITDLLAQHTQEYKAYPVLQFFHYSDRRVALPLQIAILGEALACLKVMRPIHHGIDPFALSGAIAMITITWENILLRSTIESADMPPIAAREWFAEHGLPAPAEDITDKQQHQIAVLRWRLLTLVLSDGWTWQDVQAGQ